MKIHMAAVIIVLVLFVFLAGSCCVADEKTGSPNGCVTEAKGPIVSIEGPKGPVPAAIHHVPTARVGKPAPGFETSAYINGGFKNIKLSDYKGKWLILCFYPGDFTFV